MPAIRRVYDDVGPPGHFGYHTREGKALQGLYDAFNEALAGKRPASKPAPAPASSTNADQA